MKKQILILALMVSLIGCATSYKPNGFVGNGGFDETELAPNYYRVSFKGNEKTSRERASDFALLRGAELLDKKGCTAMQVVKSNSEIKTGSMFIPQRQTTNLNATSFGGSSNTIATSTTYGGGIATLHFPRTSLEVQCSTAPPDISKGIYNIPFVLKSLKEKYEIK